jgi:DNA-directed RNA polymerase specialized sigma24 family protein
MGMNEPQDGFTREEKMLIQRLTEESLWQIYAKMPTSRMKAITVMHFEAGYNQETIARIFGVSQEWVSQELKLIKRLMLGQPDPRSRTGKPYKPLARKEEIDPTALIRALWILSQS